MRPPEFTGGNPDTNVSKARAPFCFNEAAGIHRRKLARTKKYLIRVLSASMRPPEFTGGNLRLCCAGSP